MIEKSLRLWLRPVVNRQKRLYIIKKLSLYWFLTAIFGVALLAANKMFGWTLPGGFGVLIILAVLSAIVALIKSSSVEPDYLEIARSIETKNPDLKATLLTAIEQKPKDFGGQLDYLQERVIGEALSHARQHNWVESVPQSKFIVSGLASAAALFLFLFVLSNFSVPKFSRTTNTTGTAVQPKGYELKVTPGDTTVELGTSVVILARFDGKLPSDARLYIGSEKENLQEVPFTKNLDDPVFGAIIPQINSDTIYRIEYDDKLTKDYTIGTFMHPSLERADANIVYPEYTKIPNKEIKDTRRFNVVENSKVTLTFTLNKAVDIAQLVSRDGSVLDLTVDSENPVMLTTQFQPQENLRYELKLIDSEGRANKAPPRFVIDVHKNMPPELAIKFPKGDIDASPIEEVTLEGEVSDDYGVTSHGFAYIMAGASSEDIALGSEPVPANKKEPVKYVLAMEDLNAQPDQLISYYMWAEDVGPDGNTRKTVSDLYFAEVRDFEQIFRESQSFMDQQQQQQQQQQQDQQQQEGQQGDQQRREQLVQLQKQIMSATWNIKRQVDSSANGVESKKDDINAIIETQTEAIEIARDGGDQSTGGGGAGGARGGGQGGQGTRGGGARGGRGMSPSGLMGQVEPPLSNTGSSAPSEPMDKAIEHMEKALEHLQETLANSTSDELMEALSSETAAYQELLKLREQENEVARDRSQQQQQGNQNQSQRQQAQLQELEMRQREDRYEMNRDAQQEQQEQQREDLQVLNRLRDLARRQNDMTERLREAESALREAQNEEERQEIQRELERLREEQVQNMRDAEELQQRMENSENRQRMQEAADQLSETRDRMQESAEDMQQGNVSEAAANSTRAERELEEMRDDFQRSTSGQFSQQMQNMRDQARELDQRQQEISQQMSQGAQQGSLNEPGTNQELAEQIQEQRDLLEQILDQMREISEQAEESEPLLSNRLYDTYRQASTENVEQALETTEELIRRNFVPQAQSSGEQAREGIQNLREGIEEAAQGVLGDEEDSLRLAREQIEQALNQLGLNDPNQNNSQARGGEGREGIDPNQMGDMQARGNEGREGIDPNQMGDMQARGGEGREGIDPNQMQAQEGQEGQRGQRGSQPNEMQAQEGQEGQRGQRGSQPGEMQAQEGQEGQRGQRGSQPGEMQAQEGQEGQRGQRGSQPGEMQAQEGQDGQQGQRGSQPNQMGQGGGGQFDVTQLENMLRNQNGQRGTFQPTGEWNTNDPNNPLTGQNYREWVDRLREVEEMLPDQELREQVAEVRENARDLREDFTRKSEEPQWDVVEMAVVKPLVEVRNRITEELAKIESKEAIVPIDRDPVPERYSELVRAYYENLGGDN